MVLVNDILTFWYGDADLSQNGEFRQAWFKSDPAFDAEIKDKFLLAGNTAALGGHDDWMEAAMGSLALCILLDQFPRNLFRGRAQAFETDSKARKIAGNAISAGFDASVSPVKRSFFYLPFMHSEDLGDQIRSVELYRALGNENNYRYALEHYYVISRFSRFPTRNPALGRHSTEEEEKFIAGFDAF